jgi:hypothetical protein
MYFSKRKIFSKYDMYVCIYIYIYIVCVCVYIYTKLLRRGWVMGDLYINEISLVQ